MCTFVQSDHVMPGYICCLPACKTYNGLQRSCTVNGDYRTLCRYYGNIEEHYIGFGNCVLAIPDNVIQCEHCLAGYTKRSDGTPQLPLFGLAGEKFDGKSCIACGRAMPLPDLANKQKDLT